jgi:hypothetical protein
MKLLFDVAYLERRHRMFFSLCGLTQMELVVRDVCQNASGGSYVVSYRATFKLTSSPGIKLSVGSFFPADASPRYIDEAAEAIREAFDLVLAPRGNGASVTIHDLAIHDVDFKICKFKQATTRFLHDYLD